MAAKPIERYVKKQIADQGGWPRILERIASGETVADVSRTIFRPDGQPISRAFLSILLHQDPERSQAVYKARDEGADAMVDDGLHLVDSAQQDRDSINKAKVQAELRLKVAGFVSRDRWGERPATVNVGMTVAMLHVDALRQRTTIADGHQAQQACLEESGVNVGRACEAGERSLTEATPSVQQPDSLT